MTTIVAIESADGVTLAWDGQTSSGYHPYEGEHSKVFVNNGIVIGVAGAVLGNNILRYANLPHPDEAGWDIDRWITNTLTPAIITALSERHAIEFKNHKVETDNVLLVVVRGRVYQISWDGCWIRRTDGTYAIGSGGDYARGALSAGAGAREALEIAAQHCMGTGLTIHIKQAEELLA